METFLKQEQRNRNGSLSEETAGGSTNFLCNIQGRKKSEDGFASQKNVEVKFTDCNLPVPAGEKSTSSIFTATKKLWSRGSMGAVTFQPPISTPDSKFLVQEQEQRHLPPTSKPNGVILNRRPFSTSSCNIMTVKKANQLVPGNKDSLLMNHNFTIVKDFSTELKEVDFVNELWNLLIPRRMSSKFFLADSFGNFALLDGLSLEESCMKFGKNYVSDLLTNCSECRTKLLAIEKFVNEKDVNSAAYQYQNNNMTASYPNTAGRSSQFLHILLRPIGIVLRRFLEEMESTAQRHMIHHRDLTGFSSFLLGFKPKVEKVFNFFKPILCNAKIMSNAQSDLDTDNVDFIWNKFIVGLNTCSDLDDELPIWQKLYKELVHVLGEYFDEICRQRLLLPTIPTLPLLKSPMLTRSSSPLLLTNNNGCFLTATNGYGGRGSSENLDDDLSSSGGVTTGGNCFNSVHFGHLWTPKVRSSLQQAFRFSEKISFAIASSKNGTDKSVIQERTFQEIFQEQYLALQKISNIESENPFKFLINLMEHSALAYKEQFTDCIFKSVHTNNKLKIVLHEIQELYTLRTFANYISNFYDEYVCGSIERNSFDWTDEMNKALYVFLKKTQNSVTQLINEKDNLFCDSKITRNEWRVVNSTDPSTPWKFGLSCNLEWPLGCVLGPDLFATLNVCLDKCQTLFHAHKCALILSLKKSIVGLTWSSLEARRKRYLARSLLECVTVVYSVLRQHLESLIKQRAALILCANSLEEMDKCVSDWITEFDKVLDTETHHPGSYIHPAVEALCDLIQKFYKLEFKINSQSTKSTMLASTSNYIITNRYSSCGGTRGSQILSSTPKLRGRQHEKTDEAIQWRSPSSVPGLKFTESRSMSNLMVGADSSSLNRSASLCHENALTADSEKAIRLVEKWLKSLRNVRTMLSAAAENSVSVYDSASVGYIIAVLCPKNV